MLKKKKLGLRGDVCRYIGLQDLFFQELIEGKKLAESVRHKINVVEQSTNGKSGYLQ